MTVVAIVPARGGSKSIPLKNLQKVGGKTLVQRTIEHAHGSKHINRIIVTSDSAEILLHAKDCGAEPLLRPLELATDTAPGDEVIVHALESIGCTTSENRDHLTLFLQPTSPLRPPWLIDECIEWLVSDHNADCLFTVNEGHFSWRRAAGGGAVPAAGSITSRAPRQFIPAEDRLYHENGCVYVTRTGALLRARNRVCGRIILKTMDEENAIDIDTPYHLWLANARAQYLAEHEEAQRYVVSERGLVATS